MLRFVASASVLAVVASSGPVSTPSSTPIPSATESIATPTPTPTLKIEARGLKDIQSYVSSLAAGGASKISSFVQSGILDFPLGFPTGTNVEKSASVSASAVEAQPTEVLNLPPYANWTDEGWNVRVHGNVFKTPNISQDKIDTLANAFLIGVDVDQLQPPEQAQARNLTRSIFIFQQGDKSVTMDFVNDVAVRPNASGGAVNADGGAQTIPLPFNTTAQGDFDVFVKLKNTTSPSGRGLIAGNETSRIQTLNLYAQGTDTGNATAYLVPPQGVTIISDIDDILRVTKIYQPKEGLLNTFARPFEAWMNMPQIYANWSSSIPNMHFHYLTTTPEQGSRLYMDFIYKTYPLGSFDTRPLNFSDLKATLSIRKFLLDKVFQTFPQRKFILVADTSNRDVMKDYPQMYKDHPEQVLCILLRNTSATDPSDRFPYDTSGFRDIPQEHYMFFTVPDDLAGLNVLGSQCLNQSVRQNVTFRTQGLPSWLSVDESNARRARGAVGIAVGAWLAALATTVFLGML
ncbi:hypothetical protein XA68_15213 [Ophiocordyceps unilateralis]|uniref:Phosphatidate phosphatase APP1 catalytic domain-containing protein n=1 Tax=Ophiocordyceps unilateralis TaxID=268505 RepID=A0A2A9P8R8_OPHUN|nr:hypothetical protein XA68_15213 [Ophiocordyceps unilateralis]